MQDSTYCWLDNFLKTEFYKGCPKPKVVLVCPFSSNEQAIKYLKDHPKFIELQRMDRGKKFEKARDKAIKGKSDITISSAFKQLIDALSSLLL